MKTTKILLRSVMVLFSVAVLAMFFLDVARITGSFGEVSVTGAQMAFHSKLTIANGETVNFYRSSYYTFAFYTSALAVLFAALSFKWSKTAVTSFVFGIVTAVLAIIFACNTPGQYVDIRPLSGSVEYQTGFWLLFALSIAFVVVAAAVILLIDYIEVKSSKGAKKTILKRFVAFLREYKSELKKVTWPTLGQVGKNTVIVLIMCAFIGAFIWLADLGLGQLLKVVLKLD